MNNIKDYREKELKNYVIGNVLFFLVFSGKIQKIIEFGINNSVNIWGTIIESALLSSIIYIYIFLMDALIAGNHKFKICYFPIEKMPGYTIFSDMKKKVNDDRFLQEDVLVKYKHVYDNMPMKNRDKFENANWYKIYDECKDEAKVFTANRDYLLCRDMNIITIWLLVAYIIAVFLMKILVFSWNVILFLVLEYIATNIAMRVKGKRLAYNVIAVDILKK